MTVLTQPDPGGQIDGLAGLVQRRPLAPRLMGPMLVVMLQVLGQDPADRSRADAMAETEEFALDAPVPHHGFCLASRWTSARISSGTGGRPAVLG